MTPSRDDVLAYVDNFLTYVDARDLQEFLDRFVEDELEDDDG